MHGYSLLCVSLFAVLVSASMDGSSEDATGVIDNTGLKLVARDENNQTDLLVPQSDPETMMWNNGTGLVIRGKRQGCCCGCGCGCGCCMSASASMAPCCCGCG